MSLISCRSHRYSPTNETSWPHNWLFPTQLCSKAVPACIRVKRWREILTQVSRVQSLKPKHRSIPFQYHYGSARWLPKHTKGFLSCDFDAILSSGSLIQVLIHALLVLFRFKHRKDFCCQIVIFVVSSENKSRLNRKINPEDSGGNLENLNLAILITSNSFKNTIFGIAFAAWLTDISRTSLSLPFDLRFSFLGTFSFKKETKPIPNNLNSLLHPLPLFLPHQLLYLSCIKLTDHNQKSSSQQGRSSAHLQDW